MAKLQLGTIATRAGDVLDTRYALPKGDKGDAATIAIGTVSTLAPGSSATVDNSGTSSAAVFNFALPQGPQGIQGVQGPTPAIVGTSTTSTTVATGSKVFTTQAGLAYILGTYVRVASTATPTTYMSGPVTAYSGTDLTVNVQEISGSGTIASWTITYTGTKGTTGTTGTAGTSPVISSTSTTSRTIATGSQQFTTAASMTAPVGTPIRIINTGTPVNYMFGLVTAISGTSITVNVTEIGGSGTFTAWTLTYSGLTGTVADQSITSAKIVDGTLVDGDISSTAAIAATKIAGVPVIVKAVSGTYPARPSVDIVIWKGSVDPGTLAVNGDYWDDVD